MADQVVKARSSAVAACMTCPLCHKLLDEATTISLCLHTCCCQGYLDTWSLRRLHSFEFVRERRPGAWSASQLIGMTVGVYRPTTGKIITNRPTALNCPKCVNCHTFCRKCIYNKLSDEDVDSCPVCDIDLGCSPIDKLRPDHALQSLRDKIFPQKKKKTEASGIMPSVTPPTKRKERSLSSLVTPPRVFIQNALTGRRTKVIARRVTNYHPPASPFECSPKTEDCDKDHSTESIALECPFKSGKGKESSPDESTEERNPAKDAEKDDEEAEGKSDLWTPLHCLVEAANRTKSSKGLSLTKSEQHPGCDKDLHVPELKAKAEVPDVPGVFKIKSKDQTQKSIPHDNRKGSPSRPGPVKRKRLRPVGSKKAGTSGESDASAQRLVDASGGKRNRKNRPIWFTLIASEDQKEQILLPQIAACYLRIQDGNVPVSVIQKYIVHKLRLKSEAEVEIMCRGQPVLPSLHLHNLIDIWLRTAGSAKRVQASLGTSAKEFVMVLSYCRKVQP